jgi:hypothetical protein
MNAGLPPLPWLAALQQSLLATGCQYASLSQPAFGGFDPAALAANYQYLFMPAALQPNPAAGTAGALRWQRATQAFARLAAGAAADAAARFQAALASTDPTLPKITTLRALHALWIDCGEAAHAAAAHSPAWAQAQAELLNALVQLRAESAGAPP